MDKYSNLIDGRMLADSIIQDIANKTSILTNKPNLVVIQVGNDLASKSYIRQKEIYSKQAGFNFQHIIMPETTNTEDLITKIKFLNIQPDVNGILVQLPLPPQICPKMIASQISPDKDVDGFNPYNMGGIFYCNSKLAPCTPVGIVRLLESTGEHLIGLHAVIIGSSNIVGQPLATMLSKLGLTVTICHKHTKNIEKFVGMADVLISATGNTKAIKSENIREGAIVIDVGINFTDNGKIIGDLEHNVISKRAKWYTPVPGGVGPMTVAILIENTWKAFLNQTN